MIQQDKLYSIKEAAALIPSTHGGSITTMTLRNWVKAKIILAVVRQHGKQKHMFFYGSEIIRCIGAGEPPVFAGRTEREKKADYERAKRGLARHGIIV